MVDRCGKNGSVREGSSAVSHTCTKLSILVCAPMLVSRHEPRSMHEPAPTSTSRPTTTRLLCGFFTGSTSPSSTLPTLRSRRWRSRLCSAPAGVPGTKPKPSAPMRTPACNVHPPPIEQCCSDVCGPTLVPAPTETDEPTTAPGPSTTPAPTRARASTTTPGASRAEGCTRAVAWIVAPSTHRQALLQLLRMCAIALCARDEVGFFSLPAGPR